MATPVTGIQSLEFADIMADGSMPTTGFTSIIDIAMETLTFNVPEQVTNDIRVEDKPGVRYVLPGETDPVTLAAQSIDVDGAIAAALTGGTWDAGTQTFDAPADNIIVYKACRVTSIPFMGKQFQLYIRQAAVSINIPNVLTKNGMLSIGFNARSITPVDGSGNAVSPWGWQIINVPPTT